MGGADFLHDIARAELQERLIEVNRTFTNVAVVTGHPHLWADVVPGATILPDSETLALEPGHFDLVIHAMALHWANDPVGQIIQCRRALRPDGLFLAAMFGGQTLSQLRIALSEAEVAVSGGLSPRILPMADVRDMGGLLQRAGLALPVADTLPQNVSYPSLAALAKDLRAMGENNALSQRQRIGMTRALWSKTQETYAAHFANPGNRLLATFELIFLAGWAPAENQPQPLRPGSAKTRLADALKVPEGKLPRGTEN